MKKSLLLACTALLGVSSALADAPEALYLVGGFNGWFTPDTEEALMPLYDEDGDGTYSGTFDIPADMMQFKVFTAATDWYSTDSFFGSYTESQPKLYSDREYSAFLYSGATGGYNCEVSNWQGGEVTFNITPAYDDAGAISYLSLNLVAPTQPAAPLMPKQLFCIGDFNDWALPELPENEDEDAVLNGSLAIDLAEGSFDV